MSFLVSIIPTLIVLGALITIHEFGHFIACRLTKVKVEKFSIGFGPELFHWQGNGTRFVVSLFPLGGYVKPAGESISEVNPSSGPQPGDYVAAPLLSRIAIVCAGVLMNYVLAYGLLVIIFLIGRPMPGTTIGDFIADYPAASSGLEAGDRIVRVNAQPVNDWMQMTELFDHSSEGPLQLEIERSGEPMNFSVIPKVETQKDLFGKEQTVKRLGITPHQAATQFQKFGFIDSLGEAWKAEVSYTAISYKAIFYLLTGKMSLKKMAGPIGIISITGDAARLGLPYLLHLTATLSISLAVINLFPIPALDGGHLLFLLIEGIGKRKVSLSVQEKATQVGFFLLLALMVVVIYNDMINLNVLGKVKQLF